MTESVTINTTMSIKIQHRPLTEFFVQSFSIIPIDVKEFNNSSVSFAARLGTHRGTFNEFRSIRLERLFFKKL